MSSERHEAADGFGNFEWSAGDSLPWSSADAATLKQFPEARLRHLADHLERLGKLNIYILAAEWDMWPLDVIEWLTALHHEGLFQRTGTSPYFQVTHADAEGRRGS